MVDREVFMRQYSIRGDGATSVINLVSLTTFDAALVSFTEQNGGTI